MIYATATCADVLDAEVLGKLPPSVQLEQITKLRDRQTTANRIKFREASTDSTNFSAIQMQSFLKRTEFRQKVDRMRDAMNKAAGFGEEGAQPIASLSGRSFIFKDGADGALVAASPCFATLASTLPISYLRKRAIPFGWAAVA